MLLPIFRKSTELKNYSETIEDTIYNYLYRYLILRKTILNKAFKNVFYRTVIYSNYGIRKVFQPRS
jgi:hypothetical protein